jgi:hypothetical protein
MSVVSVATRAGLFHSKASTPETAPASKRVLVIDFTNIVGANCSSFGDTSLTMRRQGMMSQNRKGRDAQ